jgi:hypothetical protein
VDDLLQVAVCAVAVCGRGLDLRDAGLGDDLWLTISGRTVGCVVAVGV